MKVDMHVHTWHSRDSGNRPILVLKEMDKKGIDAIAVVNHETTKGWKEFPRDRIIPGIEFKTDRGHLLGFWVEDYTQKGVISFEEALDVVRDSDGLAVIAHPFDLWRSWDFGNDPKYYARKVDGIEICNSKEKIPTSKNAKEFASMYGLITTAGTDSHFPMEVGLAYVYSDATDLSEFREDLRKGKTKIKCGYEGKIENLYTYLLSVVQYYIGVFGRP